MSRPRDLSVVIALALLWILPAPRPIAEDLDPIAAEDVDEEEEETAAPVDAPAARSFGRSPCRDDCFGHAAGFLWARRTRPSNPYDCFDSPSTSFQDGCRTWFEQPSRDPAVDDQGRPINLRGRR